MRIDLQPRNILKQQEELGRNSRWKCSAICQKEKVRPWLDVRFDLEGEKITDPLFSKVLLYTCFLNWVVGRKSSIIRSFIFSTNFFYKILKIKRANSCDVWRLFISSSNAI